MRHPYLFDMAIHHVDMLRQISGREIAEVDARAWRVPDSPFRHEPTVEALLTLDDGTAVAYEGTLAAATAAETSWNGDWELVGSRARATWTGGVRDALRGTVSEERYGERAERAALPRLASLDGSPCSTNCGARCHGDAPDTSCGQPHEPARSLRARPFGRGRAPGAAVKIGFFLALVHDRPLRSALRRARGWKSGADHFLSVLSLVVGYLGARPGLAGERSWASGWRRRSQRIQPGLDCGKRGRTQGFDA